MRGTLPATTATTATTATNLLKKTINLRLAIICMLAASVGLSMAIINLSKLLLVICGVATWLFNQRAPEIAPQPERLS